MSIGPLKTLLKPVLTSLLAPGNNPPPIPTGAGNPAVTNISIGAVNAQAIAYNDPRMRLMGSGPLRAGTNIAVTASPLASGTLGAHTGSTVGFGIPTGVYEDYANTPYVDVGLYAMAPYQCVEAIHDGQQIDVALLGLGGSLLRISWNNLDGTGWKTETDATWNARFVSTGAWRVDFGTRQVRWVRIEFANCIFGGVHLEATASWAPPSWPRGPKIIATGDSVTYGTFSDATWSNTNEGIGGWLAEAGHILGWHDLCNRSVGGTGWTNAGMVGAAYDVEFKFFTAITAGSFLVNIQIPQAGGGGNWVQTAVIPFTALASAALLQPFFDAIFGVGNTTIALVSGSGYIGFTLSIGGIWQGLPAVYAYITTVTPLTGCTLIDTINGGTSPAGSAHAASEQARLNWSLQDVDNNTILLWPLGVNDLGTLGNAQTIEECLAAGARSGAALQVVVGAFGEPQPGAEIGPYATLTNLVGGIAAKYGALYIDPYAGYGGQQPWFTGTGWIGAAQNNGCADLYFGANSPHPSRAGHMHYGRMFAASLIQQLAALQKLPA